MLGAAQSAGDADRTVAAHRPGKVVRPRISGGPCRAVAWVRRSRVGSCRFWSEPSRPRRAPRRRPLQHVLWFLPDRAEGAQSSSSGVAARSNATAAGSVSCRRGVNQDAAVIGGLAVGRLERWRDCCKDALLVLAIKLKSERFAESRQRAFGGIGFCRLECDVVDFARRGATAFTRAMAFANNDCSRRPALLCALWRYRRRGMTPRFSRARTQRVSTVSRLQPSKPKIRLASEIAYQPSI